MLGSVTSDDILIIHNANPVYSMPGAAEHIRRAGTVVYLGTYRDETAELATWVLPIDSPFESWGDYEPWTGVHGLIQPVTPRLHDTRAIGDILLALAEVEDNHCRRMGPSRSGSAIDGMACGKRPPRRRLPPTSGPSHSARAADGWSVRRCPYRCAPRRPT